MIPILYAANERDFSHNGIGLLRDTISCEVTEERNGVFEIALSYPVEGQFFDYISEELIVKAKPNETSEPQLFRLYKSSKPIDGIITWSGEHISYELNGNPLKSFEVKSGTAGQAIQKALSEATFEHSFSGWSDIGTLNSTTLTEPASVRSIFGGISGSIIDRWGGEYEFDNYNVKLHSHRGKETDIVIEYGKNLTDIKQEKNIAAVYTAVFPWAKYTTEEDSPGGKITVEHILTLPEKIITAPNASSYAHSKALIMDFSGEYKDKEIPTEATLRQKTTAYIKSNPIDVPNINITASFVQLWQTPEYKNIAPLERVCLCDSVTIRFIKLGIFATAKVIKTVYDVLTEQYKSVELGNAKSNFGDTLNKQKNDINNAINAIKTNSINTTIEIKEAIKNATNLITGNSGGYVVLHPAENPQEILILDAPNIETALKVWRWNSSGLGYSKNGYNGNFALAMTMDGAIVADFITAGVLNGALLRAGSVTTNSISVGFKQEITDSINNSAATVTQQFKIADEQLLSTITKTLKEYSTTTQMSSAISQNASSILFAVSQNLTNTLNGYSTTTQMNSAITASANSITSTVSATYATKSQLNSYSTTTQMNSAISQRADSIMSEVNLKVNNSEFGTKITQNAYSVQFAWNNISKYIEFSGGAMNIYESTAQGSNNLLMKMNYSGAWYYYSGTTIGKIGTNSWSGDDSFRGLLFQLNDGADYMTWVHQNPGGGNYIVKLIYYANNKKAKKGLHFSCDTYCDGNLFLNENIRATTVGDGGGGWYSENKEVGIYGKTAVVSGGAYFVSAERKFIFYNSTDLIVDCYNNIDMHNYNVLNQSDARLKTNIQPAEIDALSLINQIELKEFNWIESGEHEEIGVIAQQLQNIIPDLVNENDETGRLSIKINKFIPYLIKAIQELSVLNQAMITPGFKAMSAIDNSGWEDDISLSDKMAFAELNKPPPHEQGVEVRQEEILIPIKQQEVNNG